MRIFRLTLAALVTASTFCIVANAQESTASEDEAAAGTAEDESDGDSEEETPAAPPPPKTLTGDIITFKKGRVLSGGQVLRESILGVEVQMLPGIPPLKIPKDQIESIAYDEIDPNKRPSEGTIPAAATPGVVIAKELSPELSRKLATPLAPEDLFLEGMPVLDTLTSLSTRMEVPLQVTDAVRQIPMEELIWKSNPAPGSTFSSLLQDHIVKAYPALALVYEFDQIVLTTRAAVTAEQEAATPPDTAPAPGETPAEGVPATLP